MPNNIEQNANLVLRRLSELPAGMPKYSDGYVADGLNTKDVEAAYKYISEKAPDFITYMQGSGNSSASKKVGMDVDINKFLDVGGFEKFDDITSFKKQLKDDANAEAEHQKVTKNVSRQSEKMNANTLKTWKLMMIVTIISAIVALSSAIFNAYYATRNMKLQERLVTREELDSKLDSIERSISRRMDTLDSRVHNGSMSANK